MSGMTSPAATQTKARTWVASPLRSRLRSSENCELTISATGRSTDGKVPFGGPFGSGGFASQAASIRNDRRTSRIMPGYLGPMPASGKDIFARGAAPGHQSGADVGHGAAAVLHRAG